MIIPASHKLGVMDVDQEHTFKIGLVSLFKFVSP
jgi:hypothetical protein